MYVCVNVCMHTYMCICMFHITEIKMDIHTLYIYCVYIYNRVYTYVHIHIQCIIYGTYTLYVQHIYTYMYI